LFARAGTILPLLPAGVETLSGYGDTDHVSLADGRGRLHVITFPRGSSTARFGRRGRLGSSERGAGRRLRIDSPRRIRVDLEASLSTLKAPFAPRVVRIDGRRLGADAWSYDPASRVLRVDGSIRSGVISALP